MRIPIREQLGLLVLFTSLASLAVVATVTWVNSYDFIVSIRSSRLSLMASLKAAQLASNLLLLQTTVTTIASRILLQNALQRYNDQRNNTGDNWARAQMDIVTGLGGGPNAKLLLQAILFPRDPNGPEGPYGLLNTTADLGNGGRIVLPGKYSNGSNVILGDAGLGFPPQLYPNITYGPPFLNSSSANSTTPGNNSAPLQFPTAYFLNTTLGPKSMVLLGPILTNSSFSLVSITVPVINNTSTTDILGYLTVVLSARTIYDVIESPEGLDNTGQVLLVGPITPDNRLPSGLDVQGSGVNPSNTYARFILPPITNASQRTRHSSRGGENFANPFLMSAYKAVDDALTTRNGAINNAGSLISSKNEENTPVSIGYAVPQTALCNWVLLVEQDTKEALRPIIHLRNILIACVFGTAGVILFLAFPIAHYSVRPIRRLKDATEKSTRPPGYTPEGGSSRSSACVAITVDDPVSSGDEEGQFRKSKKSFMKRLRHWRRGQRQSKAEVDEDARRRTFRIPGKVQDRKHLIKDELSDLTRTFNEMTEELVMQYEKLEDRVRERTSELELSKKAAEAANESKTLFIANISHELKTPLNGILGIAAVTMQEEDITKVKRSLGIIYKSGELLLNLLNDLLTFSKNQFGHKLTLNEQEFRLADIGSQISTIFEQQAQDGGIDLGVVFEGPTDMIGATPPAAPGDLNYSPASTGRVRDMILWGDRNRILQVIINLVSNSLKFTPSGGSVQVLIRCVGEDEKDKEIRRGASVGSRHSKNEGRPTGSNTSIRSSGPAQSQPEKRVDTSLSINVLGGKPYLPALGEAPPTPPAGMKSMIFEFEVQDTGPGIPEHLRERVFEPFVQGDLGLSKKYGGTGLGLSICSQLATLMKGSITLHSEVGCGSTFSMRIPLKLLKERSESGTGSAASIVSVPEDGAIRRNDARPSVLKKSVQESGGAVRFDRAPESRLVGLSQPFFTTSPPTRMGNDSSRSSEAAGAEKIRILVAEDNKVNQEVVLRMLRLEDISDVTLAMDGQEALEKVKESMQEQKLFSLIFMDIQMPNLDGLQSTRLIRQTGYSAPIVALTAFAEESNVRECMESGMNYFLAKPIKRLALRQVLNTYCSTIIEENENNPQDNASTNGATSS
ncbi:MAG: Histidine kinase [Geoglossum umbratile]|nr:MAG: Histidine kinase [Geoglossum umbratile]